MDVLLNTLYILTPGAYLRRERENLVVEVERAVKMKVPIHHVDGVALFGRGMASPSVMALCQERGVSLTFLSEAGRLMARVDAPRSGNVLVRREQFRRADRPEACVPLARSFVAGKLHNARTTLLRAARESTDDEDRLSFARAASLIGGHIEGLPSADSLDGVRGHEGDAARVYFGALPRLIRAGRRSDFPMEGRSRRPPLDRVNALLSFSYALVLGDCVSGLVAAGLDPDVGFLHADRPGRPSLALDLLEEFRTLVADRLALALINRQQVGPDQFLARDGGGVELTDAGRRAVITAYVARKRETVKHPLLDTEVRVGQLPFLQAKVLARHLRGDCEAYLPCILR